MNAYEIAVKLVEYIVERPENRYENGSINWDYTTADLYIDGYTGPDELVDEAIEMIYEAVADLPAVVYP